MHVFPQLFHWRYKWKFNDWTDFFLTMLLSQATKEDSLISTCLVCFGTVLFVVFFLMCAYAYTYVQVYTYMWQWAWIWIEFYILLKNSFCHQRVLPAKYFCPFPVKTLNVALSNIVTVFSLNNTLLTLCLLTVAAVRLYRKSDRSLLLI